MKTVVFGIVLGLGLVGATVLPANADSGTFPSINDEGLCLADVVSHNEVSHLEKIITPGKDADVEVRQRWSREVFHNEQQFKRKNPGQEETFTKYYKYKKVITNSQPEYRWKQQTREVVPTTVTENRWKRWVEGTNEVREYRWEAVFKKGKELLGVYVEGDNTWKRGDPNTWYELPEHKQPERFDGIAPTGNVAVSVYGGPGSWGSVPYRYGISYTVYYPGPSASDWTTDETAPATPSGSSWGTRISQIKVSATEGHWEYYPSADGWTTETPVGDWQLAESRLVPGPDTYTDWANVDWTDWSASATPPVDTATTRYVNQQERTVKLPDTVEYYNDGNWTTDTPGDPWVQIDSKRIGNGDAIAPFWEYKTVDGVTTKKSEATWFRETSFDGWKQFSQNTVLDYIEYYVSGGEPTGELGDANWTTDTPKGWTFVDERKFVIKEAIPPVITSSAVVDREAWQEPVYGPCKLARTGGDIHPLVPISVAVLLLGGGALLIFGLRRLPSQG